MTLIFKKHITRDFVQNNLRTIFLFGDNMQRTGLGGQAAAMRGEPNAFGVPTKWSPFTGDAAYFCDEDFKKVKKFIDFPFDLAIAWLESRQEVCLPTDGLGTGLSQLSERAPTILEYIGFGINELRLSANHIEEIP